MINQVLKILDCVDEGIIIINSQLEVQFLNEKMKELINIQDNPKGSSIIKLIPSLNKGYFIDAISQVIEKDRKFFFSSAMHQGLITNEFQLNIKLNHFEINNIKYAIIECIDVTSQVLRFNQLKDYTKELKLLNKKLIEQEKEIKKLAYYDNLTGLANRAFFYSLSEKILHDAKRNKKTIGFMFIDIDRFKDINDNYGHAIGDKVLVKVAKILQDSTRKSDIVARHGGDEFLILLSDCKNYDNYKRVVSRIEAMNRLIEIKDGVSMDISLSIGVSFYPRDGESIDRLISKADKAMYKVKKAGGNQCSRYCK